MADLRLTALSAQEQAQVVVQQLKQLEAEYLAKSLMRESLDGINPMGPNDESVAYRSQLDTELERLVKAIDIHRHKLEELGG